jgi:2-polyprenyl-6-methoxyphenol hydroxylase-like FAD-dependent oxidoreductase
LETDDGGAETFDLVVCADGYHSAGRQIVSPDSELKYRGLLGWRGIVAETDADVAQLEGAMVRVLYPAGHGIAYLIPGPDGAVSPGDRLAMWGFYLQVPPEHLDEMLVDADGRQWTASVPLGKVHPAVTATLRDQIGDLLPPAFADLIDQTGQSSLQAIYSTPVPAYHHNRLCLLGDAGAVLPPFTASGVLKAMTNATELADALAADEPLDQALSGWSDSQQRLAGPVWQRAEYIERHLVFDVPDLFSMSTTDANAWMRQAYATVPLTLPDD